MKDKKLLYGIGGVLIGGSAVWLITSTAINSNNTRMMNMVGVRSSQTTMRSETIDAHFIEQMIPHHEDAITMAKLAQTRAKTPEVKQLAENIIESQGKEIDQMKVWYKEWYGKEVPSGNQVMGQHGMMGSGSRSMHMGMMGNETDISRLENADDFDREFVEQMIPHHQMAVMMAQMLKNGTDRPEMKQLADDIIAAQTSEINQMRSWLVEWEK